MRLGRSENFVRSGNFGCGVNWEVLSIGRMLLHEMNVLLQLHVDCVCYHPGDCRVERLVHSITVVLQVV
jgi:hypothetical protein